MRDFPKWQKKDLFSYIGVGARDVETRSLHVIETHNNNSDLCHQWWLRWLFLLLNLYYSFTIC